jgi:DNA-binding transcriptional LysR family regulator
MPTTSGSARSIWCLARWSGAANDDLETELLFGEELHVAAHIRHPCQRRRKVTLAVMVHEPWCLPALDSLVGQRRIEAFPLSGLDLPRRTVTSVSMQLQMGLATTQNYLTMYPTSLLRFDAPFEDDYPGLG